MMPEIPRIFFMLQMAPMLHCNQLGVANLSKLRRAQLSVWDFSNWGLLCRQQLLSFNLTVLTVSYMTSSSNATIIH